MSNEQENEDTAAAIELIDSLEDWFCQGAVTSRVGDLLSEIARSPAFKGFEKTDDPALTDEALAHERMASFSKYAELIDYLLEYFVSQIMEGAEARESVMRDIAAIVIALVEDESKQHFTCVPFIAGALDHEHFNRLIIDTQNMLGEGLNPATQE